MTWEEKMRRSALLTLATLGGLVSLIGGAGLFSALTDTARTGTNSADSAPLAASADIQLATAAVDATGQIQCGTFVENLASPLFTVTDVSPGYSSEPPFTYLCLQNVGSQSVTLSVGVDELVDVDVACTGDEALNGDMTCGGDLAGELGVVLHTSLLGYDQCDTSLPDPAANGTLSAIAAAPRPIGPHLNASATRCYSVRLGYFSATAAAEAQRAQSDRVTWRFRFDAQAQP
jgi:hypothetical protein